MTVKEAIEVGNMADGMQSIIDRVHKTACDAGWYMDPQTGEPIDRNFGEVVALMHSELSEASVSEDFDARDDKLTQRMGVEVELADCFIRIADTSAARGYDLSGEIQRQMIPNWPNLGNFDRMINLMHRSLSNALEADRKSKPGIEQNFAECCVLIIQLCKARGYDLVGAILEKDAFNRTRADHKLKNRRETNGKAY